MPDPASDVQEQRQARLAELETTRRQIEAYQNLLQEVPSIFERKFRERLQPLLERNRQIAAEGQELREQLARALPAAASPTAALDEPPGPEGPTNAGETADQPGEAGLAERFSRLRRPLLWGLASGLGGLAIALTLIGTGHWSQRPLPAGAKRPGAEPATAAPRSRPLAANQAEIASSGSWIEVQDAQGQLLFTGILQGQKRYSLQPGLRLRAGRPDLVTTRIGRQPATVLGTIDAIGWHTIATKAATSPAEPPTPPRAGTRP